MQENREGAQISINLHVALHLMLLNLSVEHGAYLCFSKTSELIGLVEIHRGAGHAGGYLIDSVRAMKHVLFLTVFLHKSICCISTLTG